MKFKHNSEVAKAPAISKDFMITYQHYIKSLHEVCAEILVRATQNKRCPTKKPGGEISLSFSHRIVFTPMGAAPQIHIDQESVWTRRQYGKFQRLIKEPALRGIMINFKVRKNPIPPRLSKTISTDNIENIYLTITSHLSSNLSNLY